MKHIFMDTNVVIDCLANRLPFSIDAAKLFNFAVNGEAQNLYFSGLLQQYLLHPQAIINQGGSYKIVRRISGNIRNS